MNLTRTFEEMQSDTLTEVARLIAAAPRVWVLGFGAEEGLARHARLTFRPPAAGRATIGHA